MGTAPRTHTPGVGVSVDSCLCVRVYPRGGGSYVNLPDKSSLIPEDELTESPQAWGGVRCAGHTCGRSFPKIGGEVWGQPLSSNLGQTRVLPEKACMCCMLSRFSHF